MNCSDIIYDSISEDSLTDDETFTIDSLNHIRNFNDYTQLHEYISWNSSYDNTYFCFIIIKQNGKRLDKISIIMRYIESITALVYKYYKK